MTRESTHSLPLKPNDVQILASHEADRILAWQDVYKRSEQFPPVLRAAILVDSFFQFGIFAHLPWFGRQLCSLYVGMSVQPDKVFPLNIGLQVVSRLRYNARDPRTRLIAFLHAFERYSVFQSKEHERLLIAKSGAGRHLLSRRKNSKLSKLLEFAISRPVFCAFSAAAFLEITPVGARDLIRDLGLRETTGRGRDCLWSLT